MKTLFTAYLPALALLALGGCAGTSALTTSENDGVYYSSGDRTTAVAAAPRREAPMYGSNAPTAPAPSAASADEVANPDYTGSTTPGTAGSDQYYSDNSAGGTAYDPNSSLFNQPYSGPGMGAYMPSSPYTSLSYGGYDPYGYGGYSPYSAYASPFYSPFRSPFGFGYGSGLSLSFGFGFGRPLGYGYGYDPFYNPFYSPFAYGGYYGGGYGGYGGRYYGDYYGQGSYNRSVIYPNGTRSGSGDNPVLIGPRGRRGGAVMNNANMANPATAVGNPNTVIPGGGRRGNSYSPAGSVVAPDGNANPASTPQSGGRGNWRGATFGGGQIVGQPAAPAPGNTRAQPAVALPQPVQGQNAGGRRGGFFGGFLGNGGNPGNINNQPMQRRIYSQPRATQPSYSQPSYSQPSYSQPSYSQPQRSSGGGNFGGGNSGGGNSGGGSRRGGH